MIINDSDFEPYFEEFEKLGESVVQAAIYNNQWNSDKLAAALVWLSKQEETKHFDANRLNRHIAIAAYIAAFAAVIAAIPTILRLVEFINAWFSNNH